MIYFTIYLLRCKYVNNASQNKIEISVDQLAGTELEKKVKAYTSNENWVIFRIH